MARYLIEVPHDEDKLAYASTSSSAYSAQDTSGSSSWSVRRCGALPPRRVTRRGQLKIRSPRKPGIA